jgi:hypothetical protein
MGEIFSTLPSINSTFTPHPPGHMPHIVATVSLVISIPFDGESIIQKAAAENKLDSQHQLI